MKMREKTKLKTIEEIPLEELESQVGVEGEFIIYCNHSYNIQQIICISSCVRYVTYHMLLYVKYDMQHIICYISNALFKRIL